MYLGILHAVIWVEIYDFIFDPDHHFTAVLRFTQLVPPLSAGCWRGILLSFLSH
jgi:hypothetical protein